MALRMSKRLKTGLEFDTEEKVFGDENLRQLIFEYAVGPSTLWKGVYFHVVREYATLVHKLFQRQFQNLLPRRERLKRVTVERMKQVFDEKKDMDVRPSKFANLYLYEYSSDTDSDEETDCYIEYTKEFKKRGHYTPLKTRRSFYQKMRFSSDFRRSVERCRLICEKLQKEHDLENQRFMREFCKRWFSAYDGLYIPYNSLPVQYPSMSRFCDKYNWSINFAREQMRHENQAI